MNRKHFAFVLLLAGLLSLGMNQGVEAETYCDTEPEVIPFAATVDPALLTNLLNLIPEIEITYAADTPFTGFLYDHIMHLSMYSTINLAGLDFLVTSTPGSLEVELYIPAWYAAMDITLEHFCVDCEEEYATCLEACEEGDTVCENQCLTAKNTCLNLLPNIFCWNESADYDRLFSGTVGAGFDGVVIRQTADTCLSSATCTPAYYYEGTEVTIDNLVATILPGSEPLALFVNAAATNMLNDALPVMLEEFFGNELEGGLLINAFSDDIVQDGCIPIPEETACETAGCSTVTRTRDTARWGINALLYGLPVALMVGLILRRRKG